MKYVSSDADYEYSSSSDYRQLLPALTKSINEKPLKLAKTPISWSPWHTDATDTGKLTQDFLWQVRD